MLTNFLVKKMHDVYLFSGDKKPYDSEGVGGILKKVIRVHITCKKIKVEAMAYRFSH